MKQKNFVVLAMIITLLILLGGRFNSPATDHARMQVVRNSTPSPRDGQKTLPASDMPNLQWKVVANGADFSKIDAVSTSEAWALTHESQLYHYTESGWGLTNRIDDAVILDIDFLSSQAGWAVGYQPSALTPSDGAIWRYNGLHWQKEAIPFVNTLDHLEMISESSGWAVGAGLMMRYNGNSWQVVATNDVPNLLDISAVSDNILWGTGPDGLHFFDGSSWQTIVANTHLVAIAMSKSDNTGWAVGDQGRIWHYDGVTWSDVTPGITNANLHDVTLVASNDVWAVGDSGTVLHYDGNNWVNVAGNTGKTLFAISMDAANHGWIGGDDSTLLAYDGGGWANRQNLIQPQAITSLSLNGVDMVSAIDGWAVGGQYPTGSVILHYDGTNWLTFGNPITRALYGLDMVSSSVGWAVGGDYVDETSAILRYDGTNWQSVSSPVTHTLTAIEMLSDSAGWAVGGDLLEQSGTIVRYDGNSWQPAPLPPNTPALYDIDMVSATDGWAVGENGTVLRLVGGVWQVQPLNLPGTQFLSKIYMVSPTDGWIVGYMISPDGLNENGLILHYNGADWQQVAVSNSLLRSVELRDILILPGNDQGWIVGDQGVVLYFQNGIWTYIGSQPDVNYNAIAMTDDHTGWIVGTGGMLLTAAQQPGNLIYYPITFHDYPPYIPTPTPYPTPTPIPVPHVLYDYDFSSSRQTWLAWTSAGLVGGDCRSLYDGGNYVLEAPTNSRFPCFRWAPTAANHHYASFETRGFLDAGSSKTEYGLYINGRGGDEYYLFKIRPDRDCGWEFIRRQDNRDHVKRRGGCQFINEDGRDNTFRVEHARDGSDDIIQFFINGNFVGQYSEPNEQALSGKGTGLYMNARSDDYAIVGFEYFTVLSVP